MPSPKAFVLVVASLFWSLTAQASFCGESLLFLSDDSKSLVQLESQVPKIPFDKPLHVVVYHHAPVRVDGADAIDDAAEFAQWQRVLQLIALRRLSMGGAPVTFDLVASRHFATTQAFANDLAARPETNIVVFDTHSNPTVACLGEVDLTARDWANIGLENKVVVFAGCNVGTCVWSPDMVLDQSRAGTRVPPEIRILERMMRSSGADSAIAFTKGSVSRDKAALLDAVINSPELSSHPANVRTARRSFEPPSVLPTSPINLAELREGDPASRLRYISEAMAWSGLGIEADPLFGATLEKWLAESTDREVTLKALNVYLTEFRDDFSRIVASLSSERRLTLMTIWLQSSELTQTLANNVVLLAALARGNENAVSNLVDSLSLKSKFGILLELAPALSSPANPDFEMMQALPEINDNSGWMAFNRELMDSFERVSLSASDDLLLRAIQANMTGKAPVMRNWQAIMKIVEGQATDKAFFNSLTQHEELDLKVSVLKYGRLEF
jgi:hypothetical protein